MHLTADELARIAAQPTRADIPILLRALAHAESARAFHLLQAQSIIDAAQPFLRVGWAGVYHPGDAPLTLTVTADDMRALNRAANGAGDTALALVARLGRLVSALPVHTALWCGDPQWRVGRYDERRRRWNWGAPFDDPIEALENDER